MTVFSEAYGKALLEHQLRERDTLERVQAEALGLERYPEGQEERGSTVVDGHEIKPKRRIAGKLTMRW